MKVLGFFLRFAIAAPICLAAWWTVMPYYGWAIGQVSAQMMGLFGQRVDAVRIEPEGILNTATKLTFETPSGTGSDAIGAVATNLAPFVALVLATGGLTWQRRLRVLGIGVAILVASHIAYLVWAIALTPSLRESPEVRIIVAQVFITMPFILWIILAYWRHVLELVATEPAPKKEDPADS